MSQLQSKKLGIVLLVLVILLFSCTISRAENICFDQDTAGRMVVELETCRVNNNLLINKTDQYNECKKSEDLYKQQISVKDSEINSCKKTVTEYQQIRENDKKICQDEIKAAKPTFTQIFTYSTIILIVGVVIGVIL